MNEKSRNILEDVMYNDDGSFRPFLGHHGNVSGDIAEYRNTYMEAEKSYFIQLLSDEKIRDFIKKLLNEISAEDIFTKAIEIQEKLELGSLETPEELEQMELMSPQEREQFHLRKLEYAEGILCLLFASIKDKALILDEIYWWEERLSNFEENSSNVEENLSNVEENLSNVEERTTIMR